MELAEAKTIVYRKINEPDLSWPDKPEMIISRRAHGGKDFGWIFHWTSLREEYFSRKGATAQRKPLETR
jgi:hypothetical protein